MDSYTDYGRRTEEIGGLGHIAEVALVSIPIDTVLIIPIGTPAPAQLAKVAVDGTTLYERLAPLCSQPHERITLTFLSGAELESLSRAWNRLVLAKNVRTLSMLPGQVEDPLFAFGADAVGIRSVSWPEIEHQLVAQSRLDQSESDRDAHRDVGPPKEAEIVEAGVTVRPADPRGPRSFGSRPAPAPSVPTSEDRPFAPSPYGADPATALDLRVERDS